MVNSPPILPHLSAARRGVAMLFIANALVFATIVTRYPELKDRFDLSELTFGLMVACGPVGSVVGSLIAGRLVARLGAVLVAVTSSVLLGVLLTWPASPADRSFSAPFCSRSGSGMPRATSGTMHMVLRSSA